MRVYISGSISKDPDYKVKFFRKSQELMKKGHEVINPAGLDATLIGAFNWKEYMNICLALLNLAEAVLMLDGWKDSSGACMEYGYALASDKIILQEDCGRGDLL